MTAACTCPADNKPDTYKVIIKSKRMLWTNKIGEALTELASESIAQEEYTARLARKLGAAVTTVGWHPAFCDASVCDGIELVCEHHGFAS